MVWDPSVRGSSAKSSKVAVVLSLEFFLELLFGVDKGTLVGVLFLEDCGFEDGLLLSGRLELSDVASFLHILKLFAFFLFFHLG